MTDIKRGFIRTLWGIREDKWRRRHRTNLDSHFRLLRHNKYEKSFTAYVFGEENYKQLEDMGFNCHLIDKRSIVWDMDLEQFRHKLEALKYGMQELDEMVFLDWDTQLIKPLPDNFWDVLSQKAPIQASLRMYHRRRIRWRKPDARKVPCAPFVYMRDKNIPDELIRIWEELGKPFQEETVLMRYIENLMGEWKGLDEYWKLYEPHFFNLEHKCRVFSEELYSTKSQCFAHVPPRQIGKLLDKLEPRKTKEEMTPEELEQYKAMRSLRREKMIQRQQRRRAKYERHQRRLERKRQKWLKIEEEREERRKARRARQERIKAKESKKEETS